MGCTQPCWMASRGGGVAVFRCGTPGADTSRVRLQRRRWLSTCVRPTANVGVSGLVVGPASTLAAGEHMLRIDVTFRGGEQAHALIDKRELDAVESTVVVCEAVTT